MDFHDRGHWLDAFNSFLGVMALKQPKKLQRWMKELLKRKGLNPNNWRYIRQTAIGLTIIHKETGRTRTIELRGAVL